MFEENFQKYQDIYEDLNKQPLPSSAVKRIAQFVQFCKPYMRHTGTVADLGCGNGELSRHVDGYVNNFDYYPQPGMKIRHCDLQSSKPLMINMDFDNIFLSHTLEHLHDTDLAMLHIKDYLADDGRLFIAVPDASVPQGNAHVPFDKGVGHVAYFTPDYMEYAFPARYNLKLIASAKVNLNGYYEIWSAYENRV